MNHCHQRNNMFKKFILSVLLYTTLSLAADEDVIRSEKSDFKLLFKDCIHTYSLTCLKLDVISWVDKLNRIDSFNITPSVIVVRDENSTKSEDLLTAEVSRSFPKDPESRLNLFLVKKIQKFLSSRSLKFKLWMNEQIEEGRGKGGGGFGGGGGKKGDGGFGAILAMGAMMKGMMLSMAIAGLGALAGKALMTALMSLMLSAILGVKSLSHGGEKHSTVEVFAKPHHERSDIGYVYHKRNLEAPLPLGLQPSYEFKTQ